MSVLLRLARMLPTAQTSVGEFAHTQFITAMLTLPAFRRAPR